LRGTKICICVCCYGGRTLCAAVQELGAVFEKVARDLGEVFELVCHCCGCLCGMRVRDCRKWREQRGEESFRVVVVSWIVV